MDERKRKHANLVRLLIQKGWSPPRPTDLIVERIAEDIARVSQERSNWGEHVMNPTLELTDPQLRVLVYAALGYTIPETAKLIGRSPETIKRQVRDIREKLGAKNMANAVAIAIRRGYIDPEILDTPRAVAA